MTTEALTPRSRWPWGVLFSLTWLILLKFPVQAMITNLDDSWRSVLAYCAHQHMQFGRDVIFTYGPLGYLHSYIHSGWHFTAKIIWEFFFSALTAAAAVAVGVRLPGRITRAVFFLTFWTTSAAVCPVGPDPIYLFCIVALTSWMIRAEGRRDQALLAGALTLGVLSLTKFTFATLSTAAIGTVCFIEIVRGNPKRAACAASCYLAGFLASWLACGQAISNLPAYVRASLEIVSGYKAMALVSVEGILRIGVTVCGFFGVALALAAVGAGFQHPDALLQVVFFAFTFFLAWKEGFVRADGHCLIFFSFALSLPFVVMAFLPLPQRRRGAVAGALAAAFLAAWLGLDAVNKHCGYTRPRESAYWKAPAKEGLKNLKTLFQLRKLQQHLDAKLTAQRAVEDLPAIRALVGRAPVDMLGYSQGALLLNGLNYRPRPVIQSYSAYDPWLLKKNSSYYEGRDAPEFVVYRMESIDDRFPTLDDSAALAALLRRYSPVITEKSYLLWRKNEKATAPIGTAPSAPARFRFEQEIPVPDSGGAAQWVTIRLRLSLLGRIREFLFQMPEVRIRVLTDQAVWKDYRLIPGIAEAGFLLNPFIATTADAADLHAGILRRKIRALKLTVLPATQRYFQTPFEAEFQDLPGLAPQHRRKDLPRGHDR